MSVKFEEVKSEKVFDRVITEAKRCGQHQALAAQLKNILGDINRLGGVYYTTEEAKILADAYSMIQWKEFEMPELPAKLIQG